MSVEPPKSPRKPKRRRRKWRLWIGGLFFLLFIAAGIGIITVQSDWFSNKVRDRIVTEVEKASGGQTEIGSFAFDWRKMRASVDRFVLHGTEPSTEAPLFRAKRVEVGIGVTSVFRAGFHVRNILVDEPFLHIITTEDGKTNFPNPKVKHGNKDFIETILELAAREITVRNGYFDLNARRVPLNLVARDVDVHLLYNSNRARPIYFGEASSKALQLDLFDLGPMTFAFDSNVALERGTINVMKAKFSTKESKVEVSGFAYHLKDPVSDFGVNAVVALSEFGKALHIPIEHRGVVQFAGKVSLDMKDHFRYALEGSAKGRGLGVREANVQVENASLATLVAVSPAGVKLTRLNVNALGGQFAGSAELTDFKKLTLAGEIRNFATVKLLDASHQRPVPFVSSATGPISLTADLGKTGFTDTVFKAAITLTAVVPEKSEEIPLDGQVNMTWTQAAGTIELQESKLATAATTVDVSGTLGRRLDVTAHTTRLRDIQAVLSDPLPIQLKDGSISFQGLIIGPLDNPRIEGNATLANVIYEQQKVVSLTTDFSITREGFDARSLIAVQGPLKVEGSGSIRLQDWKANEQSPLTAKLNLTGARIEKLLAELKQDSLPVTGAVTIAANIRGTVAAPTGDAQVSAEGVTAWDESIDRIKAGVKLTSDRVEITDGSASIYKSTVPFSVAFTHRPNEWNAGSVTWSVKTQSLDVTPVQNFNKRFPQWKATVTSNLAGAGTIANKTFQLTAINGDTTVRGLTYEGRPLGNVDLRASTSGTNLNLNATASVRTARVKLNGDWKLEGDYPGGGEVSTTQVSVQTLRDLFQPEASPLPFQSAVEAGATFQVPLADLNRLTADVRIQRLFIAPGAAQRLGAGAKEQDLILENARPIALHATPTGAVLEPALFHATNTSIEVGGRVGFTTRQGWDLTVKGGLNLGQLQIFRQDLLASGTASIDATVRGTLTDPQVNGSLTLAKASLYFGDLPTGLDNVNGTVTFDRNRATIQSMSAESGGGKMGLTGFVGFGGVALVYRLQGNATGVRVRYPEGASTTVNANLNLTGTSQESLLAGTVTIVRAAFQPRSDLGSLISNLTKQGAPAPPQDNDYIRGMALDVRIESEPNLEFQTSLTRGLQAEVDLRLRGTAARPTLLGDVGFSEGEISLFGNKYTLNRGEIRFFNPTRIEPVFDLEAETRARGIDVNISFSGTPSKLNVSYRSDPPLQPSEIIALLAIGRDPNVSAGIASSQITQQSTTAGLGNVVGEAVASSVTNRLQKFFGVTRIKIDPQLTGLDNIPQARLTLEQQVSKDITLTFITNISRTQEQIVRIQYDLSREWSAIAVREENGLFGLDVQYKKRFK